MEYQEGKERFRRAIELYTEELSGKERELLDPLLYEILYHLNSS